MFSLRNRVSQANYALDRRKFPKYWKNPAGRRKYLRPTHLLKRPDFHILTAKKAKVPILHCGLSVVQHKDVPWELLLWRCQKICFGQQWNFHYVVQRTKNQRRTWQHQTMLSTNWQLSGKMKQNAISFYRGLILVK